MKNMKCKFERAISILFYFKSARVYYFKYLCIFFLQLLKNTIHVIQPDFILLFLFYFIFFWGEGGFSRHIFIYFLLNKLSIQTCSSTVDLPFDYIDIQLREGKLGNTCREYIAQYLCTICAATVVVV
jgi:hypothetical protein